MMFLLAAQHALAAQRGEGLRPELISLLNNSKAGSAADCASATAEGWEDRRMTPARFDLAPSENDSLHEIALRLLTK